MKDKTQIFKSIHELDTSTNHSEPAANGDEKEIASNENNKTPKILTVAPDHLLQTGDVVKVRATISTRYHIKESCTPESRWSYFSRLLRGMRSETITPAIKVSLVKPTAHFFKLVELTDQEALSTQNAGLRLSR